jgi:hypothetical protein
MNFTESFSEFSSRLGPKDLALYAGVGLVLWVLFKDKLSPVQKLVLNTINTVKRMVFGGSFHMPTVDVPKVDPVVLPKSTTDHKDDTFFKLVVSWKQTRDLAEKSGCTEAIKVADQMFPFLSPTICSDKKEDKTA